MFAHLTRYPFSSVLRRLGAALLELGARDLKALLFPVLPLAADVEDLGMDGSGFTVTLERAESVLELVMELKREAGSFLVIVTGALGLSD